MGRSTAEKRDERGRTALHLAAPQGRQDLVEALLFESSGGDVMARDRNGNTPLHYCGHTDTIRCLVEHGADVLARNKNGDTPLELMKRRGVEKEAIHLMEELISAVDYDDLHETKQGSSGRGFSLGQLCEPPSIWSEFCSDVGVKRLVIILVCVLGLSFYVACLVTGMSKQVERRIPIDSDDVNRFEL